MAIKYAGAKVSPREWARMEIEHRISMLREMGIEDSDDAGAMTDRERELVETQLGKELDRVYKLLRLWELRETVFTRPSPFT